jgi:hypothetical protein
LLDNVALGDGDCHSERQKTGDDYCALHMFLPSWVRSMAPSRTIVTKFALAHIS